MPPGLLIQRMHGSEPPSRNSESNPPSSISAGLTPPPCLPVRLSPPFLCSEQHHIYENQKNIDALCLQENQILRMRLAEKRATVEVCPGGCNANPPLPPAGFGEELLEKKAPIAIETAAKYPPPFSIWTLLKDSVQKFTGLQKNIEENKEFRGEKVPCSDPPPQACCRPRPPWAL